MKETFYWVLKSFIVRVQIPFQLAMLLSPFERFKAMYEDNQLYTQLLTAMSEQESKWSITT